VFFKNVSFLPKSAISGQPIPETITFVTLRFNFFIKIKIIMKLRFYASLCSLFLFTGAAFATSDSYNFTDHLAGVERITMDTCPDFLGGPWGNFNTEFGGAPVANAEGECAFNEITAFQVWASESYVVNNFVEGVTYTFSICNGDYGAWPVELAVLDADDVIVAHAVDTCRISWTATYSGTYRIGINEMDACGELSANQDVDNGFPALTCSGAEAVDTCLTFLGGPWTDFNTEFGGAPEPDANGDCPVNQITTFEVWASESYIVENFQEGVTYTFSMCEGSFGAWSPELSVIDSNLNLVSLVKDTCRISWTAEYTGSYIIGINEVGACGAASQNRDVDNGFPTLTCESIVGTNEVLTSAFSVYPNPNNGDFTIESSGEYGAYFIEVFDMVGKLVYRDKVQLDNKTQVATNITTNGTYLVKLTNIESNKYRSLRMVVGQ